MRSIRALLRHPLAGPTIRYVVAGGTVAVVYLGTPLALNGVLGVAIQVAIPLAYVLALTLHFNLQRHLVFWHIDEFAVSVRQQIGRYMAIGAIQYPITALATAFLPGFLGVSERVMFVVISLCISATSFLVLRGHVFHPTVEEELTVPANAEQRAGQKQLIAHEAGAPKRADPVG